MSVSTKQGIKILFISHEFTINGSTRSLLSLIEGMHSCYPEIVCDVLVPKRYGRQRKAYKECRKRNITVRELWYRRGHKRIDEKHNLKLFIYDVLNTVAIKAIKNLINQESYDVICSNSSAVDLGVAAIDQRKAHIQFVREEMEKGLGCEYRNKERMRRVFEESNGVVFVSDYLKQCYLRKYKVKNYVRIYNGFKIDDYYVQNHRILKNNHLEFVQVGALSEAKGLKSTIHIMGALKRYETISFHITFVGEGDSKYVFEVKKLIEKYDLQDNVSFVGYASDVRQYLQNADILLVNSSAEGFGRVVVEGMLAGCLVVGRATGGTKELIEDNVTGALFENEEDAVKRTLLIIKNGDDYTKIAQQGQSYARDFFSNKKTAMYFVEYINNLLSAD